MRIRSVWPLILWIATLFLSPEPAAACRLILFVDDSASVAGHRYLDSKLRRLMLRLVNNQPPIEVAIVPIGGQRPSATIFTTSDDVRGRRSLMGFGQLYTHVAESLEAGRAALRPGGGDTVVILSDLLPDHDNNPGFNDEDFGDLAETLRLLTPDQWNGAQVHVVLLGEEPQPPPRLPAALRRRDEAAIIGEIDRFSRDFSQCWAAYQDQCRWHQRYLSMLVASTISDRFESRLRFLNEPIEVSGYIGEILFNNPCMPEVTSETIPVGWFATSLPYRATELLSQELRTEQISAHQFPRRIEYRRLDLSDPDEFSQVRFVLSLERGLSEYEATATLHSVKQKNLWGPSDILATDARSLLNRTRGFLNENLRKAIEQEIPPLMYVIDVQLVYGADRRAAPGYTVRFEMSRDADAQAPGRFRQEAQDLTDPNGLVELRVPEAKGQLLILEESEIGRKAVDHAPFDATKYFDKEVVQIRLDSYTLTLTQGRRNGVSLGNYRYQISKKTGGAREPYVEGGRISDGSTEKHLLPKGTFIIEGLPDEWARYLQWERERVVDANDTYAAGDLDPVIQDFVEFVEDDFATLHSTGQAQGGLASPRVRELFAEFDPKAANFTTLPKDIKVHWDFSPYVFLVLSQILAREWESQRQPLQSALELYRKFGHRHPLWLMRRSPEQVGNPWKDPETEAKLDRQLRDYLELLWRYVVFEDAADLDDLERFLRGLDTEALIRLREDTRVFFTDTINWEGRFKPLENESYRELKALLDRRGMLV